MRESLVTVEMRVNGATVRRSVRSKATLLQFLREELGLKGTKRGCGREEKIL